MSIIEPSTIKLRFISLEALHVHEEVDPYRVERLKRALQRDGKLRHPPIVTEFGEEYVVLDGASRTAALTRLGYPHILVQVVDYEADTVTLSAWVHVIVGMAPNRLLSNLAEVNGLEIESVEIGPALQRMSEREVVSCIVMRDGKALAVPCRADINAQAQMLCELVAVYRGKAEVHRTTEIDLATLAQQYPDLTAIIAFPDYTPNEILKVVQNGNRLPMGITRHLISGRALGLDIPLGMFSKEQSLEEKNTWMAEQIRMRLRANKVRLYQEPVLFFDE